MQRWHVQAAHMVPGIQEEGDERDLPLKHVPLLFVLIAIFAYVFIYVCRFAWIRIKVKLEPEP